MSTLWGQESPKVTFDDHIKPIFREHCSSCHNNSAKKSGLSLETYQATMEGGSSGEVLLAGDLDSSRLYALTAHKEQPVMPPMQDRIPQEKLDLLKTWVEQGMPENSGSAIRKPMANAAAITVAATGRPEGPPPMPKTILRQTPQFTQKAAAISALAASPWSPMIAVGGQMQVILYHALSGEMLGILPFPEGEPQSITFSRDGRLLLVGGGKHSSSGHAVLYDVESGNRIAKVGDELDTVLAADISDDNRWIALAGPQKIVRVYNTLTGELKWEQKKHTDWIYDVRFSPDGVLLATSDRAAGLIVWETGTGRLYADLQGHKNEIRSIAWRPDSAAVVSASMDGTLKIWDMNESKLVKSWDAHGGGATAVAICNDGTMVSTGRDRKVKVWDAGGNAAGEMPALAESGLEVAITVDGTHVAAGDWAGNVRLWTRANSGEERQLISNPPTLEMAIATSQQKHAELLAASQAAAAEAEAAQTKAQTVQQTLAEQQAKASSLASQLSAASARTEELKGATLAAVAKKETLLAALQAVSGVIPAKSAELAQLVEEKKQVDAAVAELRATKEAGGGDPVALDAQIAQGLQSALEKASQIAERTAELNALTADKTRQEKEIAELDVSTNTYGREQGLLAAQMANWAAAKASADEQAQKLSAELPPMMETLAAAQAKHQAATAASDAAAARLAAAQQDLARFQAFVQELETKKNAADAAVQSIAQETSEMEKQMVALRNEMTQAEQSAATLTQQLAELQAKLQAAQQEQQTTAAKVNEHQQALNAKTELWQQAQADQAALEEQRKIFQSAYKRP